MGLLSEGGKIVINSKYIMVIILMICMVCVSCSVVDEDAVLEFELSDIGFIDRTLNESSPENILGEKLFLESANTSDEVKIHIEPIWFDMYEESEISVQRPYIVCINEDESLWYIYGNDAYLDGAPGGVVNAIISKEDGEVLAIWHTE